MISREEFIQMLTPEQKAFILECICGGLEDYNNSSYYSIEARRDHTPSVRSHIRNCHIVARARRALMDRPDVRIVNKKGRILFIIEDKCRISFKKFNTHLRSSNVPTQQSLAFLAQLPLDIEMPEQLTNIIAGYRYGTAEMDCEIYITCPLDQENYWEWKLSNSAQITDFFSHAASESDNLGTIRLVQKRVRIRPGVQRKENENA